MQFSDTPFYYFKLGPSSTFKLGTGGEESRGRVSYKYSSHFHASAILSFWLVSLIQKLCVLFSRLVRHISELCTLSASPSSRGIHGFSCKMSSLPLIPFQFIPFCLTGSKWPVQWGDPWWPDGSQLFLSRWIFHMLLCVPQLWVSRWEMLLHPLRGWCYPHLQPQNVKFLWHLDIWLHLSSACTSRQN